MQCDLQEPACNRCLDSGKTCEGYARYPVFLNRTNQGLMKRDRLEEAKGNPIREEQRKSQPSKPILASASSINVLRQDLIRRQHVTMNSMPLLPSNANVSEAQLISAFWECYVPSSSIAQAGSPCPWLQQSICLPNPPSTLRLSLKALAMVTLGWLYKDEASVRGGRVTHGDALRELQKALYDERLRWQDETMATCKVLAVYEVSKIPMARWPLFSLDLYSFLSPHLRHLLGTTATYVSNVPDMIFSYERQDFFGSKKTFILP